MNHGAAPNPHALPTQTYAKILKAAAAFGRYWNKVHLVTLHGSTSRDGGWWTLGEIRCYTTDGHCFKTSDETVWQLDDDVFKLWEKVAATTDTTEVNAAAVTLDAAEPWIAVGSLDRDPVLTWRTTTANPINYDHFVELPAS